jgi:hypothetical protein
MNDLVKSVRLIHYALILVSSAIIVLAVSPDHPAEYRKAIAQLEALNRLQFEDFANFCAAAMDHHNKRITDEAKTELRTERIAFIENFYVYRPFYCWWPTSKSSMSEIQLFFALEDRLSFVSPAGGIAPAIRSIRSQGLLPSSEWRIASLSVSGKCLTTKSVESVNVLANDPVDLPPLCSRRFPETMLRSG